MVPFRSVKFLVNPFAWCLLFQSLALYAVQRSLTSRRRAIALATFCVTLLLAVLSTPLSRAGLEASLMLAPAPPTTAPAFIFVLGGGYLPGTTPEEDVLIPESQQRVLRGVALWGRYTGARMVFSGAADDYNGTRPADRLVQLMAETARSRWVPASAVVLEPRSHNTREHPVEALTLPGVLSSTPIAIVTSDWHMRRALREFCRHFQHVHAYPVPSATRPVVWQDIVPDAGALAANTVLLREWIGMLWYVILDGSITSRRQCT